MMQKTREAILILFQEAVESGEIKSFEQFNEMVAIAGNLTPIPRYMAIIQREIQFITSENFHGCSNSQDDIKKPINGVKNVQVS